MDDRFVPIEALAKHFSVSVSTARAWLRQGLIPTDTYIKVGATYRFSIPLVVAALMGQRQQETAPEPEAPASEEDSAQMEFDFTNASADEDI